MTTPMRTLARRRDWDTALAIWAAGLVGRAFAWGRTDCTSLVRDGLAVMDGTDRWPEVPRPASALEARAIIRAYGTVPHLLAAAGAAEVPRALAQTGDVWWDLSGEHGSLGGGGLVIACTQALAVGEDAAVHVVPLATVPDATQYWRLPWPAHE